MKKFIITTLVILFIFVLFISIVLLTQPKILGNALKDARNPELTKVNLYLKWLHQAQFAGNYVAKDKGFYMDLGLDVDIIPYNFIDSSISQILKDTNLSFGIAGADELILARANGAPVKAIAVIYKTNPSCIYSLKEKNISTPYDLLGKTIAIEKGSNIKNSYYMMLKKLNINTSKINEITIEYDPKILLNESIDITTCFIINEPYGMIKKGKEVSVILLSDYGVDIYADVIFTTEKNIKERPDLVKKFLKATLDGWHYSFENTDNTLEIVMNYSKTKDKEHETYMLKQSIPLIYNGITRMGWMEERKWENLKSILLDEKGVNNSIETNDFFTNEFLEKIYNQK